MAKNFDAFLNDFLAQLNDPRQSRVSSYRFLSYVVAYAISSELTYDREALRQAKTLFEQAGFRVEYNHGAYSNESDELIIYRPLRQLNPNDSHVKIREITIKLNQRYQQQQSQSRAREPFKPGFNILTIQVHNNKDLFAALAACVHVKENHITSIDYEKRLQVLTKFAISQNSNGLLNSPYIEAVPGGSVSLKTNTWYQSPANPYIPKNYDEIQQINPLCRYLVFMRFTPQNKFIGIGLPGGFGKKEPGQTLASARLKAAADRASAKLSEINGGAPVAHLSEECMLKFSLMGSDIPDLNFIAKEMIPDIETLRTLVSEKYLDQKVLTFYAEHQNEQHKICTPETLKLVVSNTFSSEISEIDFFTYVEQDQRLSNTGPVRNQALIEEPINLLFPRLWNYRHEFYENFLPNLFSDLGKDFETLEAYLIQATHHIMQEMFAHINSGYFPVQINCDWEADRIFEEWVKHIRIDFTAHARNTATNLEKYAQKFSVNTDQLDLLNKKLITVANNYQEQMVRCIKIQKSTISNEARCFDLLPGIPPISPAASGQLDLFIDYVMMLEFSKNDQIIIGYDGQLYAESTYKSLAPDYYHVNPTFGNSYITSPNTREAMPHSLALTTRYEALEKYIANPSIENLQKLCLDPNTQEVMTNPYIYVSEFTPIRQWNIKGYQVVICDKDSSHGIRNIHKAIQFDNLRTFINANKHKLGTHSSTPVSEKLSVISINTYWQKPPKQFANNRSVAGCELIVLKSSTQLTEMQRNQVLWGHRIFITANSRQTEMTLHFRHRLGRIETCNLDTSLVRSIKQIQSEKIDRNDPLWSQLVNQIIIPHCGCFPARQVAAVPVAQNEEAPSLLELVSLRDRVPFSYCTSSGTINARDIENLDPTLLDSRDAFLGAFYSQLKADSTGNIIGVDPVGRKKLLEEYVLERDLDGKVTNTRFFSQSYAGTLAIHSNERILIFRRYIGSDPVSVDDGLALPGGIGGSSCQDAAVKNTELKLSTVAGKSIRFTEEEKASITELGQVVDLSFLCNQLIPSKEDLSRLKKTRRISQEVFTYWNSKNLFNGKRAHEILILISGIHGLQVTERRLDNFTPYNLNSRGEIKGVLYQIQLKDLTDTELYRPERWKYIHEIYLGIYVLFMKNQRGQSKLEKFKQKIIEANTQSQNEMDIQIAELFCIPSQVKSDWTAEQVITTWVRFAMFHPFHFCQTYSLDPREYANRLGVESIDTLKELSLAREIMEDFKNFGCGMRLNFEDIKKSRRRPITQKSLLPGAADLQEPAKASDFEETINTMMSTVEANQSRALVLRQSCFPNENTGPSAALVTSNPGQNLLRSQQRFVVQTIYYNPDGSVAYCSQTTGQEAMTWDGQIHQQVNVERLDPDGTRTTTSFQGVSQNSLFASLTPLPLTADQAHTALVPYLNEERHGDEIVNRLTSFVLYQQLNRLNDAQQLQVLQRLYQSMMEQRPATSVFSRLFHSETSTRREQIKLLRTVYQQVINESSSDDLKKEIKRHLDLPGSLVVSDKSLQTLAKNKITTRSHLRLTNTEE